MNDPYCAPAAPLAADRPARRRPLWALMLAVPGFFFGAIFLLIAGDQVVVHGHRYWFVLLGEVPARRSDRTGLAGLVGFGLCGLLASISGRQLWINRRLAGSVCGLISLLLLALTVWAIEVSDSR